MKKITLGIAVLVVMATALTLSSHVRADDRPNVKHDQDNQAEKNFNPNNELSKSACGTHLGNPVIDVVQKVQNDADSGVAGNYWAFDYYTRHITVWQTVAPVENGNGTYCALVTYDGNFYAVPGQIGPGNIPAGALINTATNEPVHGDMSGGRRATIIGTLLASPLWATHGNVGTTNYQCDITGTCPGAISWAGQYFATGYSNTDVWWGWKYTTGNHGMWINAISGNSGNIL